MSEKARSNVNSFTKPRGGLESADSFKVDSRHSLNRDDDDGEYGDARGPLLN